MRRRDPGRGKALGVAIGTAAVLALVMAAGAQSSGAEGSGSAVTAQTSPRVVVAVGDVACDPLKPSFKNGAGSQGKCAAASTFAKASAINPDKVLMLGDAQYEDGRLWKFRRSYALAWGKLLGRTRPVPGNHEYFIPNASGYFSYFNGAQPNGRAGRRAQGYYSFDLGRWHLIALNSNCAAVGCAGGSDQFRWLSQDLQAHPARCILAFWHHPRFSSGGKASPVSTPFWRLLYKHGADVVLNGHDHIYERFLPQNAAGGLDRQFGLRELIAGTGGKNLEPLGTTAPNSAKRDARDFGVLKLTLRRGRYAWRFVAAGPTAFSDHGTGTCHGAPLA